MRVWGGASDCKRSAENTQLSGSLDAIKRGAYPAVMDLKAWIDLERGRQTKLAAEIGAQPQLVWQWAHGKRPIPADRRPDIERGTGGEVTCEEMTSDEVVWSRISDDHWKWHPLGRPVRDVTREAA